MAITDFPKLKGTPKQIAWAEDIRRQWLDETVCGEKMSAKVDRVFAMDDKKQATLREFAGQFPGDDYARIYNVATQDSAKWFIEHRPHGFYRIGNFIMRW